MSALQHPPMGCSRKFINSRRHPQQLQPRLQVVAVVVAELPELPLTLALAARIILTQRPSLLALAATKA
jgi:hypothetical protein